MLAMDSLPILVGLRGWSDASMASSTENSIKIKNENRNYIRTWNVTSLSGKEPELADEASRYRLDIVGVSSTKRKGNETLVLNKRWQLFYSGVDPALHAQAGVGILTNPRLAEKFVEWRPISERVALLRLKLKEKTQALEQAYAPNTESEYAPFLDEVSGVLEGIPGTDSIGTSTLTLETMHRRGKA